MKYRLPGPFLISLLALCVIAGCGGGGGGASAPVIDAELFTPNYIASLDLLLHWDHLPMRVSFDVPANSQDYGWGLDDCMQAANQWNQPGKQSLVNVVPFGTSADVVVQFVSRADLGGSPNSTGITSLTYNPSTRRIVSATIKVAPESPFGGWLAPVDIRVTVAHEIGHALGIHGHSPVSNDLMHATSQLGRNYPPTIRDFNTAMSAYPSYFAPGALAVQGGRIRAFDEGELVTVTVE